MGPNPVMKHLTIISVQLILIFYDSSHVSSFILCFNSQQELDYHLM